MNINEIITALIEIDYICKSNLNNKSYKEIYERIQKIKIDLSKKDNEKKKLKQY